MEILLKLLGYLFYLLPSIIAEIREVRYSNAAYIIQALPYLYLGFGMLTARFIFHMEDSIVYIFVLLSFCVLAALAWIIAVILNFIK